MSNSDSNIKKLQMNCVQLLDPLGSYFARIRFQVNDRESQNLMTYASKYNDMPKGQ